MPKEEHKKIVRRIIDEEVLDLRYIVTVFSTNMNRVLKITRESRHILGQLDNPTEEIAYMHDSVRAGIVFLHATLETTLREIVRVKLKNGDGVSHIPLAGSSDNSNRKVKFVMKDLLRHKGKSVNAVIEESVDEYLGTLSFSKTDDIAGTMDSIGIRQDDIDKSHYSMLNQMINRRHKIVHEGDMMRGTKPHQLESIEVNEVLEWIYAVHEFCIGVINLMKKDIFVPKIMARLQRENIPANEQGILNAITIESKFSN